MPRTTIASHVLDILAQERRVVAADWRFHVIYDRVAHEFSYKLPDIYLVRTLIGKLQRAGDIEPIEEVHGVYRVTVPYASTLPAPDEVIVQEANPFAVFSNFTAAAYHELTDVIPGMIYATNHRDNAVRHPVGTTPDDWTDVRRPRRRTPAEVNETRIIWSATKREWDFGHMIGHVQGCPFYVTDLERTLLDSLRFPDKSGGIREVFRIWRRATDAWNVDRVVEYADRFGQALLRQRAGFLFEELGFSHPALDGWAERSVRGSSAKLAASREFCSHHSERWNLSINVPASVLSELHDS